MRISGTYSHKEGAEFVATKYPHLLREVEEVISLINAESCRLKRPKKKEIARAKRANITHFFSPPHFNALFDWHFSKLGWDLKPRINTHDPTREGGYREIDIVKESLGVELQFGKYSFLTYDIIAKMVIFRNLGVVDAGIEICLMASMLPHMSSGIGAFEQVVWDLQARGVADIDVPVLVIGIESEEFAASRPATNIAYSIGSPGPEIIRERNNTLTGKSLAKVKQTGADIR